VGDVKNMRGVAVRRDNFQGYRKANAMRNLCATLGLLGLTFGCGGGHDSPPAPLTAPTLSGLPSPPTTTSAQVIAVGEEVKDTLTFNGDIRFYELTSPSDGTLVTSLSWDPSQGRLQLDLDDRIFANFPDNRSPLLGELAVTVGRTYRVTVADGAPWDYGGLRLPFTLTTSVRK